MPKYQARLQSMSVLCLNTRLCFKVCSMPKYQARLQSMSVLCLNTRLGFKVCLFTHKHLFTRSPPARYSTCTRALTVQHALIDWPLFSAARAEILKACTYLKIKPVLTTIPGKNFPAPVLCSFLRKIGYLEKIMSDENGRLKPEKLCPYPIRRGT